MKIVTTQFAPLLLMILMVACTSIPTSPANPATINALASSPLVQTSLPDLIIKLIYLEMTGRQSNCVEVYTAYEIRVLVENIGLASAGPFVVDLNGMRQQVDESLAAGQLMELYFAGTTSSGRYEATADLTNQVVEREEDNNTLSFLAPTPTPPPLCTATPTPVP